MEQLSQLRAALERRDIAALAGLLRTQAAAGRTVAAICAAPAVVLKPHGLLPSAFTHFPAAALKQQTGGGYSDAAVVVDGNTVTSKGPGTALQFGLKLVEVLVGREKAEEVAAALLTPMPE